MVNTFSRGLSRFVLQLIDQSHDLFPLLQLLLRPLTLNADENDDHENEEDHHGDDSGDHPRREPV